MANYIFKSLNLTEQSINKIKSVVNSQIRFNKATRTFSVVVTMYALLSLRELNKQNKKIKKLMSELEKIKYAKGE